MTRMDCGEVRELLNAYVDGEMPAEEHRAVAEHMEQCENCARALASLEAMRHRILRAGDFTLPQGLETRLRARLGLERQEFGWALWRKTAALAASHFLALAVGGVLMSGWLSQSEARDQLVRDVAGAHIRALLSDQLVQMASSDTHTVKPWLSSKVPYAPEIRDLAAQGFPLLGARVDYVLERQAAALVYTRRKHRINLFVVPAGPSIGPETVATARAGYNILAWRQGGFAYFAASDLNAEELQLFAVGFRAQDR
jgi:anti-sigma factor RsiW